MNARTRVANLYWLSLMSLSESFRLLVDLNAFTKYELAMANDLPANLDGAWEMMANTHPNTTDQAWVTALNLTAPNKFVVAEENPTDHSTGGFCPYCECAKYKQMFDRAPSLSFGYHEAGNQPNTALNRSEIAAYSQQCGTQVLTLTRWYKGDYKAQVWHYTRLKISCALIHENYKPQVQRVLNCSALAGVAMEFNPGDKNIGKRGEVDYVRDLIALGKKPFFLMPPAQRGEQPFGRTQEENVNLTLSLWASQGMPLHNDGIHVVIARYGLPMPCSEADWSNVSCVYGRSNSVRAALQEAMRFRDALRHQHKSKPASASA